MISRRYLLKTGGIALFGIGAVPRFLLRAALAAESKGKVLVVIFQRGGADGLNILVPHGEPDYYTSRPSIAIPKPQKGNEETAIDLDGFFGLHPSLAPFEKLYRDGRLAVVAAAGSPHNTRSHFDAQDFMETATPGIKSTTEGWLNRHLQTHRGGSSPFRAVAFSQSLPLSLAGRAPVLAMSSLEEFQRRAQMVRRLGFPSIYEVAANDPIAAAGRELFEAVDFLKRADLEQYRPEADYPRSRFGESLKEIARLIKAGVGLEVAFAEVGGWDTHVLQGGARGQLAARLREFGAAIAAFCLDLGDKLDDVVLLTMTEFGRTVRENGNAGTDHGHASLMFLAGAVRGGRIYGRWPGLKREQLFEERDLDLSVDFRDVFAEVLARHLGNKDLAPVFPGYRIDEKKWPGCL